MTRDKAATNYPPLKPETSSSNVKKKRRAKWLKFGGGAVLLIAFGLQMNQNRQAALVAQMTEADQEEGHCIEKALGYENLYFSSKLAGGENSDYLQFAAQEYLHGRATVIRASGRSTADEEIAQLKATADNVHDLVSLSAYFQAHNADDEKGHQSEIEALVVPNRAAMILGLTYIWLYAIGTLVVLTGQALDPVS